MSPTAQFWFSIQALASLVLLFCVLSSKYELLRNMKMPSIEKPAYSLSRVQMAFWTFNTAGAFLLLLIHRDYPAATEQVVPNQALILMGISIATRFGGDLVDHANGIPSGATDSFWRDICSGDGERIDLHRFQMLLWTLLAGGVFWTLLVKSDFREIPQLDNGLLLLMGISGTAYLGLKARE